jgi:hypothetical protein
MKLSNFQLKDASEKRKKAAVQVTDGHWPFKKIAYREIAKDQYTVYWYFTDTGEFAPDYQAERLYRAWCARHG